MERANGRVEMIGDLLISAETTALILTYNEAPNIGRILEKLDWVKEIVAVDSLSTDQTPQILKGNPKVRFLQRDFDEHTNQWNFGLRQVKTDWVLSLDADYLLTDEIIQEIKSLPVSSDVDGYFARFKYCIFGKPLHGTILPPRQVLFRKDKASYDNDGHTQKLLLNGKSSRLNSFIFHDDRKSLSRWLWAQDRYTLIEANKLARTLNNELSFSDKVRKLYVIAPPLVFLYCLIIKGVICDGWRGWYYAFQRMLAEVLLSVRLMELRLANKDLNDENS